MVRIFQVLSKEKQLKWLSEGLTIESAADYTPKSGDADHQRKNDVPWIKRFAAADGRVIISGNTKMKQQPHERLALVQEGMVTIFFESQWSEWPFFRKCALLLNWWPAIMRTAKTAKPGTFWHVPADWKLDGTLRPVSNDDAKLTKIQNQKSAKNAVRARRKAAVQLAEQGRLNLDDTESDSNK